MTLTEVIAKLLILVMNNVDCKHLHCLVTEDKLIFSNHIKSYELSVNDVANESYAIDYIRTKLEGHQDKELKVDFKNRLRLVDALGQEVL